MSPKFMAVGLATLCFGACTPGEPNVYRISNQERTIGRGQSVTITNVANEAEALPFAEHYCNARNGVARFDRMERLSYHHTATNRALFDCISRPL